MDNNTLIKGLHHITTLSSDAQKNIDFFSGILGLRLVKKTVNFDAPDVYHLYFGNSKGDPGTIMTLFPYSGLKSGRKGIGQVTATSFSVPIGSLDFWLNRFENHGIAHDRIKRRFEEDYIYFEDDDGLGMELVANNKDNREGYITKSIPAEFAIKGFYGITLNLQRIDKTSSLLIGSMGYKLIAEDSNRYRFSCNNEKAGSIIDILISSDNIFGLNGSGTVHHVAFAVEDDSDQLKVKSKLTDEGYQPTPVIDRQYFHSVYFREPGGILFEIATSDIGFTIDESEDHLGENLKLPPQYEKIRTDLENALPPVNLTPVL